MAMASARPFASRAPFRQLSVTETPWISERDPAPGQRCGVLASDGRAQIDAFAVRQLYVLPFACICVDGSWCKADRGAALQVDVIGWLPLVERGAQ